MRTLCMPLWSVMLHPKSLHVHTSRYTLINLPAGDSQMGLVRAACLVVPQNRRAVLRGRIQRRVQIALSLHLCLQSLLPRSRQHVTPGFLIHPCQDALSGVAVQQDLIHQQGADIPVEAYASLLTSHSMCIPSG